MENLTFENIITFIENYTIASVFIIAFILGITATIIMSILNYFFPHKD